MVLYTEQGIITLQHTYSYLPFSGFVPVHPNVDHAKVVQNLLFRYHHMLADVIIGDKIPKNTGLLFPKKIGVISPKSSE